MEVDFNELLHTALRASFVYLFLLLGLQYELRLKREEHLRKIKEARLEPSGQVSVIKEPSSKPVKKKDQRLLR